MSHTQHPGETPEERRARRYAQSRAWAQENREKTRCYSRAYYQRNAEACRAYSCAYYQSHKAERAVYSRAYYRRKRQADAAYFERQNARNRARRAKVPRSDYASLVYRCRRTLTQDAFSAMERDRARAGERIDAMFLRYPFEDCADRAIRRRLAKLGIFPGRAEYDDCYDAGMLAYLYTMHRCAVLECDYVIPYLMKMIGIYIACARILSRDAENLCAVNGLRVLRIDDAGAAWRV